jgi:hypothetical protein
LRPKSRSWRYGCRVHCRRPQHQDIDALIRDAVAAKRARDTPAARSAFHGFIHGRTPFSSRRRRDPKVHALVARLMDRLGIDQTADQIGEQRSGN